MAAALRLIVCLVLACVGVALSPARADTTLPDGDVGTHNATQWCASWAGAEHCFGDPGSGCAAAFPSFYSGAAGNVLQVHGSDCHVYVPDSGYDAMFLSFVPVTGPVCNDANSVPDTAYGDGKSACKCNSGFATAGGGACREPQDSDCPSAGTDMGGADNILPRMAGGGSCVGGCQMRGSGSVSGPGGSVSYGPYTSTGKACSSSQNQQPVTGTPADCARQGLSSGTVNGTVVCVPATSTSTSKSSSTSSTSASGVGSGSTTTTETTDNKDGSETTTTTTTNSDGSHTTTTTTGPKGSTGGVGTGAGGSSGSASGAGSGSSDQSSDTCHLHPDLAMCKVSSFGGSCSSTFTCDGDAVQCSIAKEQHQRDCAFFDPASQTGPEADDSDRYTHARSDGDNPAWSPVNAASGTAIDLDFASNISTTKHWGSACVQDSVVVLTMLHRAVVIPWSSWCDQMQMIGKLVLACAWIAAAGIVFKP